VPRGVLHAADVTAAVVMGASVGDAAAGLRTGTAAATAPASLRSPFANDPAVPPPVAIFEGGIVFGDPTRGRWLNPPPPDSDVSDDDYAAASGIPAAAALVVAPFITS